MSGKQIDEAVERARQCIVMLRQHLALFVQDDVAQAMFRDADEVVAALTAAQQQGQAEAVRLLREYRKAPKFSNDHDAIKRTVALEDEIDAFLAALTQQPAADPLVEWGNRPLNFTATVGTFNDGTQLAGVDEAYPTPRNRAEAVALAKLALAHLGVIDAHIDAAIARCETDVEAQQGDHSND